MAADRVTMRLLSSNPRMNCRRSIHLCSAINSTFPFAHSLLMSLLRYLNRTGLRLRYSPSAWKKPRPGDRARCLRAPLTNNWRKYHFPARASGTSARHKPAWPSTRFQPRTCRPPLNTGLSLRTAAMVNGCRASEPESSGVNTIGSATEYVPPRSRMVTRSGGPLELRRDARVVFKAAGNVANGPSMPSRAGFSNRPDHRSFPFVATISVSDFAETEMATRRHVAQERKKSRGINRRCPFLDRGRNQKAGHDTMGHGRRNS